MNRPLRVLIVEDVEGLRHMLMTVLPKFDARISTEAVGSLAEAVDRLKTKGIDVVLLDLVLPDANELHALTTLRELIPTIPIVVMTGSGEHNMEKVILGGAEDFILKGTDQAGPLAITRSLCRAAIMAEVSSRYREVHESLERTGRALSDAEFIERRYEQVMEERHEKNRH